MPFDLFPDHWNRSRDGRDWLTIYREAEGAAEAAAEAVRAACAAYKARRSPETEAAYRQADKAYDVARAAFQRTSYGIVNGVRAVAGIARAVELADAGRGRMI